MSEDKHGVEVYPHVAGWDTVPVEQIAIGADAMPADVAEALFAKHSAGWCERLIDELLTLMEVAKDAERHARIWDSIDAQLRVAQ